MLIVGIILIFMAKEFEAVDSVMSFVFAFLGIIVLVVYEFIVNGKISSVQKIFNRQKQKSTKIN